jgi:hypothetical protein
MRSFLREMQEKFLEIESFQGGGSNLTPTFYMLAVVYIQQFVV